jgi:hypothetical protein
MIAPFLPAHLFTAKHTGGKNFSARQVAEKQSA